MKKLKYKGFTLVELLAVIVILGIIALITTPVITKSIINAKLKNFINGAYQIIKAGDLYYLENDMEGKTAKDIVFDFPNDTSDLQLKGEQPIDGQMVINKYGEIALAISDGNYCIGKSFSESKITAKKDINNCNVALDEALNGAYPELKEGMIPVIISGDGTVYKSHSTSKWHDYANKEWANAVTVKSSSRDKYMDADEGTIIKEADILTYFVWVPRYKYKLWYTEAVDYDTDIDPTKVHSIEIVFENKYREKSNGFNNGEFLTHPAFTLGDKELNGFWIGKFETGYSGANSTESARSNVENSNNVIIKANSYAWTDISLKNSFYTSKNITKENNIFGLSKDSDSHLIKNTEWGAVAYLSHSSYGKNANIYKNNNSSLITGCGANEETSESSTTCTNEYGTDSPNYNQSTTGNITGIFDMSGGASEFVMGYNPTPTDDNSEFTSETLPEEKYINLYNTEHSKNYNTRILGDATGELGPFLDNGTSLVSSWYNQTGLTVTLGDPWFVRGGTYSNVYGGIFYFDMSKGAKSTTSTFRIIIS